MLGVTGSVIAIVFLSIIFQKNNSSDENLEKFKPIDRINRLSDISFRSKNYFSNTNNDLISIQES